MKREKDSDSTLALSTLLKSCKGHVQGQVCQMRRQARLPEISHPCFRYRIGCYADVARAVIR